MTYLAPRQGLFAIIILISFCLQTLLLVISTDQQLSNSRQLKGEQMVAQLIDEARLSLENQDRVSLSVIANRYTSEQDVTRLVIKDNNDEVLVPVGNAPMQQGNTISQIATNGDAVIGSVALTLKDISKGEIITMQWPFVIGSMILHLLLLLVYSYVARPTKEQISALSQDIEDVHREQYARRAQAHSRYPEEISQQSETDASAQAAPQDSAGAPMDTKAAPVNTATIHSELNAYLKSQQSADNQSADNHSAAQGNDSAEQTTMSAAIAQAERETDATENSTTDSVSAPGYHAAKPAPQSSRLSSSRALGTISVHITFHDEYNMLERLAPETRMPYLALCTQLLQQALTELLKQPLLLGISAVNKPYFDENGALAVLKADNSHAKVALAGVMLGKLYLMLNKIIHDKHIELSRFALPAKIGVSDEAQVEAMTQLLASVGKKEQMLILLPHAGLKQIGSYVQVQSVKRPTTVYERECAIFDGGNDAMMQRLADVRNSVLMTESEA
ncbi:hypothetical protein ACTXGJ_04260 [Psychrobacter sp. 1Y11]|uniref:hypothetical protein n=1 Tax=Psychrobacter sp. 1Y11 TaxID=3457446 RepID=UPI003FCF1154